MAAAPVVTCSRREIGSVADASVSFLMTASPAQ